MLKGIETQVFGVYSFADILQFAFVGKIFVFTPQIRVLGFLSFWRYFFHQKGLPINGYGQIPILFIKNSSRHRE